jgi:hypothetical protein
MSKPRSFAPIVAAILLLLPVLYVGSYLALVNPEGLMIAEESAGGMAFGKVYHYRVESDWPAVFYWPLEQVDRQVRPASWNIHFQERI